MTILQFITILVFPMSILILVACAWALFSPRITELRPGWFNGLIFGWAGFAYCLWVWGYLR